jgi:hypothetical protein
MTDQIRQLTGETTPMYRLLNNRSDFDPATIIMFAGIAAIQLANKKDNENA